MKRSWSIETITALLILLFAYTALSKLLNLRAFSIALEAVPILKKNVAIISWLLPVSELLIVLLLLLPATRTAGLYVSLIALTIFTGYLIYMVLFLSELPRSCGGALNSLSWKQHIIFNLCFLIMNIGVLKVKNRAFPMTNRTPP